MWQIKKLLRFLPMALLVGTLSTPSLATYTPLGDSVFSFDNTFNSAGAPPTSFPVLDGSLTGSGGNITGFNGTVGGSAVESFTGLGGGGYAGGYTGPNGAYAFNGPINFSVTAGGSTYTFGSFGSPSGSNGNYTVSGTFVRGSGYSDLSIQTYSAVAAPEIDGSVVPKAGFVIAGLFWLLMYRRRQTAGFGA